jgi:hypothetical protein
MTDYTPPAAQPPIDPLRIFIGVDPRQTVGLTTLFHSIAKNSSKPVAITPLILSQLPITRRGLTEFTYSRFLVPWLCNFRGRALFMDADIVVTGDVAELFELGDMNAVQVMQEQPQFEWPSVMLFNCGACLRLTPEYVNDEKNALMDLKWAPYVGKLPPEWNHCVGYQEPKEAKLYHYTQGLPCWFETKGLPEDHHWTEAHQAANATVPWKELMGGSRHAQPVLERLIGRYVG